MSMEARTQDPGMEVVAIGSSSGKVVLADLGAVLEAAFTLASPFGCTSIP